MSWKESSPAVATREQPISLAPVASKEGSFDPQFSYFKMKKKTQVGIDNVRTLAYKRD